MQLKVLNDFRVFGWSFLVKQITHNCKYISLENIKTDNIKINKTLSLLNEILKRNNTGLFY